MEDGQVYEIQMKGTADQHLARYFCDLEICCFESGYGGQVHKLTAVVKDQPQLRGLVTKIWDMNMEVISINRMEEIDEKPKYHRTSDGTILQRDYPI